MKVFGVLVVVAMAGGCGVDAPNPQAEAGGAAGSSGAGGSVACDDARCAASCYYSCGGEGVCTAVEGESPACSCACK